MNPEHTVADARRPAQARRLSAPEAYALWAESYDSVPNPILALQERVLGPLLPQEPSRCLVDVGCGTGRWLENLHGSHARSAVGVDFSLEMLRRAARKPLLRGRLICAHSLRLPLRSCVADLVICSFLTGHVPDLSALADELARIAGPGAHMFVSDFHPASYSRGWKRTFRYEERLIEVESVAHPVDEVCRAFASRNFTLEARAEPCFGEPERPIFEKFGKLEQFAELTQFPAVYVCHFRRK